jgi:hypothetical protein
MAQEHDHFPDPPRDAPHWLAVLIGTFLFAVVLGVADYLIQRPNL